MAEIMNGSRPYGHNQNTGNNDADKVIVAVDQSTAATKTVIFSKKAEILAKSLVPHKQHYPSPGWVEHDPSEIAVNLEVAVTSALESANLTFNDVDSIALTNQRETVLVWNRETGLPVYNALVWQDGRAAAYCEFKDEAAEYLRNSTGLEPSPFFSAPKVSWILDNVPGAGQLAEKGKLAFGTIDSYLLFLLTGGKSHKCDVTNASRTLLMNLETLRWDERAFSAFNIPLSMAPEIILCDSVNEVTAAFGKIPSGIPIASMIGDSHAALFGQCCFEPGSVKATYGTGSSVMMNIGAEPKRSSFGLVTSVAYGTKDGVCYCLEGNINTTGGITKWMCEGLGILESASQSGKIAASLPDNDGVYLIPALAGLAAPHWKSDARAAFVGMTSATTLAHLIRAGEEAIAYQIADVVRAMEEDLSSPVTSLRVDGGPTRDKFLMDFQAGILQCSVDTAGIEELSALGAAFIAGLATGFFKSKEDLAGLRPVGSSYAPSFNKSHADKLYAGWKNALKQIIG